MKQLRRCSLVLILIALGAGHAAAQTALVDELAAFTPASPDETFPVEYTQGADGMLYGVVYFSRTRYGAVYRIDPATKARAIVAQLDFDFVPGDSNQVQTTKMVLASDHRLYGTFDTYLNPGHTVIFKSAIFRFDPATNTAEVVKAGFLFSVDFSTDEVVIAPDGGFVNSLAAGSDGWIYGTLQTTNTPDGGGGIFKMDPASGVFIHLTQPPTQPPFDNGFVPTGVMQETTPGVWIVDNAVNGCGELDRYDAATNTTSILKTFTYDDGGCEVRVAYRSDGVLIGTTRYGASPQGQVFTLDATSGAFATLHEFDFDSFFRAWGDASLGADGFLYQAFWTQSGQGLTRIDTATGAPTFIASVPVGLGVISVRGFFQGDDGRMYAGVGYLEWKLFAIGVLDAIPVAPATGPVAGTTSITATLKTIGVPLPGRTIAFTLNGDAIGSAVTNEEGVATLDGVSLSGIAIGTYANAIGASYAGDDQFPAASGNGSLTVFDAPTPGLMIGHGFVRDNDTKHEFAFIVVELANGANLGAFELTRKTRGKTKDDRFVASSVTGVVFDGDSATFAGAGKWNGLGGYRFTAVARDVAGPGNHDTVRVTIFDSANHAIVTIDREIDGGNIQSVRLPR